MALLAVIPARGGSKGIPRKNIKLLGGKPLIAHTILEAKKCEYINKILVSTDDNEIAEISKEYGASVPFLRPSELAADQTPTINVILDVINKLNKFDEILLLQPTSPLRRVNDINRIVEAYRRTQSKSMVSLTEVDKHPNWMYSIDQNNHLNPLNKQNREQNARRQDLDKFYVINGAMYLCSSEWLKEKRKFIDKDTEGYIMAKESSIDIDTEFDWKMAEAILNSEK